METDRRGGCKLAQICSGVDHSHCAGVLLKHSCLQERMVALGALPPRKKSADLGSSRCEVDIKRVYDGVIRPGNLSNAGLILPTCRLFRLSFMRLISVIS